MNWSCRSHSPPWSQIGQSSGRLISRNSLTPSRAFFTIGVLVLITGGSPLGPGRQSRTAQAQLATGLGEPTSPTRHMRQLPAIDRRSWKQKRGISAPAASHAWSSVYSGGTSISLPSTISLVIADNPQRQRPRAQAAQSLPEAVYSVRPLPADSFAWHACADQDTAPSHDRVPRFDREPHPSTKQVYEFCSSVVLPIHSRAPGRLPQLRRRH